jgi:hypothetical protein
MLQFLLVLQVNAAMSVHPAVMGRAENPPDKPSKPQNCHKKCHDYYKWPDFRVAYYTVIDARHNYEPQGFNTYSLVCPHSSQLSLLSQVFIKLFSGILLIL